ncbi:N-glycosylase/DNA lyase [Candidatus Micrarchaeota archaeon]|jgi:N-glycosylase/DNA lyase|nr:N-glycosylase/DNA lyase [Candidatus Micrarchaeota archaeon]
MQNLIKQIELHKKSKINSLITKRLKEFKSFRKKHINEIFNELCFCVLTANYSAEGGINIQTKINEGFSCLTQEDLTNEFKKYGYRFPKIRAEYICSNRDKKNELNKILNTKKREELREWIVKNIKGLGYKEASHFLRNIGYFDYAIIDFHIINLLVKNNLIKKPKTLTKNKYLEIENILKKLARELNLSLGELDLYLWYIETGKVLK